MAEKISSYFGIHFAGMDLSYVVEDKPLGTGGAVRLAMTQCTQDHVFVLNGDTFLDFDAVQVERKWSDSKRPLMIGCEVADTARYGRLLVANDIVTGFTEKGFSGPGLINAGCYVLSPSQLDVFSVGEVFSLEADYLVPAVQAKQFDVFVTYGKFIDIGVPDDFLRAQTELAAC